MTAVMCCCRWLLVICGKLSYTHTYTHTYTHNTHNNYTCLITENFQATTGERSVTFFWPSPSIVPIGNITGFNISCSPSPPSLPLSFSEAGTHAVRGFSPNTVYNCSLKTHVGQQTIIKDVSIVIRTKEDCKF